MLVIRINCVLCESDSSSCNIFIHLLPYQIAKLGTDPPIASCSLLCGTLHVAIAIAAMAS